MPQVIHSMRSSRGLVGNTLDVDLGTWKRTDSGVGAGVDSYYEYLLKVRPMSQGWAGAFTGGGKEEGAAGALKKGRMSG